MNFKCPQCHRYYYIPDNFLSSPKALKSGKKGWRIFCEQCAYEWEEEIKALPLKESPSSFPRLDNPLIKKDEDNKENPEKLIKERRKLLKKYPEENTLLENKNYPNFIERYFWRIFLVIALLIVFGIIYFYQRPQNFFLKNILQSHYQISPEFIKANDIQYVTHFLADGKKRIVVIGNLINTSGYSLPLKPLKINISLKKTDSEETFQNAWTHNWPQSYITPQEKLDFQSERILPKELEVSKIEVNIF